MNEIICVGNPNVGKTSLFNLLTGLHQKVANFSGVTIQEASGNFEDQQILDLPGFRSIWSTTPDEQISIEALKDIISTDKPILFVASGMHLQDSLLLFTQIADLQSRMALIINFEDEMEKSKISVDALSLEERLGCPVVVMNSRSGEHLEQVKQLIRDDKFKSPSSFCRSMHDILVQDRLINNMDSAFFSKNQSRDFDQSQDHIRRKMLLQSVLHDVLEIPPVNSPMLINTTKFDKIALHPFWGSLLFIACLLVIFQTIFAVASYPMEWIDVAFAEMSSAVQNLSPWPMANSLIADGVLSGIGGVLIFIPQIALLFFLLAILESTGYMSRISFLSDRLLRKFGLSGSSVVPLLSAMACSIPAMMSTRSIKNPLERLAVIMVTPFMTCSARLPVYIILIALIVPDTYFGPFGSRGLVLLMMYLLGVVAALLFAWIMSRVNKQSQSAIWILDLPVYRAPHWTQVWQTVYRKTKSFVVEAGKVIFIISIVLWFLASFSPKNEEFIEQRFKEAQTENTQVSKQAIALEYSYAGYLGKSVEPVISPLGYDWKIGIALISSFAAREVFVGSLSTIYSIGSEKKRNHRRPIVNRIEARWHSKVQFGNSHIAVIILCICLAMYEHSRYGSARNRLMEMACHSVFRHVRHGIPQCLRCLPTFILGKLFLSESSVTLLDTHFRNRLRNNELAFCSFYYFLYAYTWRPF